jgi:transposase
MDPQPSTSSSSPGSAPSSGPPGVPDAAASRNAKGHYTREFKLAAVRYVATSGMSRRAAARDLGLSDKTLGEWLRDARPAPAAPVAASVPGTRGVVDAGRFDELAQLRGQNRELLAQAQRLTAERDFLKKAAAYFAKESR